MAPTKAAAANLKRKDPSRPTHGAKKQKFEAWADISAAVSTADLSEETKHILLTVLPLSLGEYKSNRHEFQEKMVDTIENVLKELEAGLVADVSNAQSESSTTESKKASLDSAADAAQKSLDEKKVQVRDLKKCLANDALTFRSARQALQDAEEDKTKEEFEMRTAQRKKEEYGTMLEQLEFLKNASPEDAESQAKMASLVALVKKNGFEDSMLIALPAALKKTSDARGQFDSLTISGLQMELNKRIAEQDKTISDFAPTEQKHIAAVEKARGILDANSAKLRASAKTYTKAEGEQDTCTNASADAYKAVKDLANSLKRLNKVCNNAEAELEVFRDGPLETFKDLKEREEPKPEVVDMVVDQAVEVALAEQVVEEVAPPVAVC